MKYNIIEFDIKEIFEKAKEKYKYMIVHMMSELVIGEMESIKNYDEVLEARFFSEKGEMHLFFDEENYSCVEIEDEDDDVYLDTKDIINGECCDKKYTHINKKKYIDFDADGQGYVSYVRCVALSGGVE